MDYENPQDIPCRSVYIVRAKPELLERIQALNQIDLMTDLARPTVVMTEELPFEKYLEGWRKTIYQHCQRSFIEQLLHDNNPFPSDAVQIQVLGTETDEIKLFEQWWTAEEADYLQVSTTWHSQYQSTR